MSSSGEAIKKEKFELLPEGQQKLELIGIISKTDILNIAMIEMAVKN
jgi:hypothetical protein